MIVARVIVMEDVSPMRSETRPLNGFEKIPMTLMRVMDRLAVTVLNP